MNVWNQAAQGLTQAQNRTRAVMNNMDNLGFTAAQAGATPQMQAALAGATPQMQAAMMGGVPGMQAAMMGSVPGMQAASMGQAPQLAGMNLSAYMNPFTRNVIDTTMGQMDRQRQQMMGQVGAQATAAGAFGGSRHGLVEAETNRGFADSMGQLAAGLNQANFQNAQQMGQFDIANRMAAGQFNAGLQQQANAQNNANAFNASQFNAGLRQQANAQNNANAFNASQFNAGLRQQANAQNNANAFNAAQFNAGQRQQANAQNANNALNNNQFNAGLRQQAGLANQQTELAARGLRLNAANQMGNLSNLGFGMGQQVQQMQNQAGAQQQQIQQARIDAIRNQFAGFTGAPQQGLAGIVGALQGAPMPTSQTQRNNPGLLGLLTGGAMLAGGLGWAPFAAG